MSFAKADLGQVRAFLDREQSEHLVKGLRGAIVSIAHGDAEAAEYLGVRHDPQLDGDVKLYRIALQVREKMTPDEIEAADRVCFPPPTSV